jgi:hypothetical protein
MSRTTGLSDGVQGCLAVSLTNTWANLADAVDADVVEILYLTDNLTVPDMTDTVKSKARGFRNSAAPVIAGRHHLAETLEFEMEWNAADQVCLLLETKRNNLRAGTSLSSGGADLMIRQTDYSNPAVGDIAIRGVYIVTQFDTVNNAGSANIRKVKLERSPYDTTNATGKVTLA